MKALDKFFFCWNMRCCRAQRERDWLVANISRQTNVTPDVKTLSRGQHTNGAILQKYGLLIDTAISHRRRMPQMDRHLFNSRYSQGSTTATGMQHQISSIHQQFSAFRNPNSKRFRCSGIISASPARPPPGISVGPTLSANRPVPRGKRRLVRRRLLTPLR